MGRPFVFDDEAEAEVGSVPAHVGTAGPVERSSTAWQRHISKSKIPPANVTPASQLEIRPAPEMVSSGISALDVLTGGLPRGCLTEICGSASSGRTTVLLAALAAATHRGEYCAVIDASDALDPYSAAAAGVDLDRLLWVRCGENSLQKESSPQRHRGTEENISKVRPEDRIQSHGANPSERCLEQVLRATDLLLESGGFGLIILDLADLPLQDARRIPLTTWFRFRRAVEHKPTILLAIEQQPIAGSCSSLLLQLGIADELAAERRKNAAHSASREWATTDLQTLEGRKNICIAGQSVADRQNAEPSHTQLLTGLNINAELIRSRLDRKPARSVTFETKTAWAG